MKRQRTLWLVLSLSLASGLTSACAHERGTGQRKRATTIAHQQKPLPVLNISFMLRGYFFAFAKTSVGIGGYGRSNNYPVPIRHRPRTPGVYLAVDTKTDKRFFLKFQAIRVTLGNSTDRMVYFRAQDSRLSIVQEALGRDGRWRPIEYLPHSFCGNSYHRLGLPAGYQWTFVAPRYHGSFRTKLRIRLIKPSGDIVSDAFWGSINPAQFSVKRPYHPRNVMDPYTN